MFDLKKELVLLAVLLLAVSGNYDVKAASPYWGWRFYGKFIKNDSVRLSPEEVAEKAEARAEKAEKQLKESEEKIKNIRQEIEEVKKSSAEKAEEAERKIARLEAGPEKNAESTENKKSICHKLLWYLPNRFIDLLDCFTLEAGVGEFAFDLYLTRYATFGAGTGYNHAAGFDFNRQYGLYKEKEYHADFLTFSNYETVRSNLAGTYISEHKFNISNADIINYPQLNKNSDPYAIGVKAAFGPGVKFQFHPVEFADFIAGLFLIDFKNDDK